MEVLSILLATASAVPLRVSGLERGISKLAATSGVVAIDAENVRGKSGFRLNHNALLAATAEWTNAHKLRGRVVLVVDHGSSHQGMYLKRHGMAVVFAGPNQKADDVLARDVGYWSAVQRRDSIVVTADGGLRKRCRQKAHSSRRLHLVQPHSFIESLFSAATAAQQPTATAAVDDDVAEQLVLDARAAAELEQLDARLRMTKSTSKRAKLERHREKLVEEAYGSGSSSAASEEEEEVAVEAAALPSYSAPLTDEEALALDEGMHALRTAGLSEPSKGNGRRNKQSLSGSKREKTWEREVLAERLRGELQLLVATEEEEEGGGAAGDGGDVEMELEEAAAAGESSTMMHEEEIYMPGSGWVSPVDMAMESDKSPAEVNKHASEQASTRPQALTHSPPTPNSPSPPFFRCM